MPQSPKICKIVVLKSPGPCDRKMVIDALNSGANALMADFETLVPNALQRRLDSIQRNYTPEDIVKLAARSTFASRHGIF